MLLGFVIRIYQNSFDYLNIKFCLGCKVAVIGWVCSAFAVSKPDKHGGVVGYLCSKATVMNIKLCGILLVWVSTLSVCVFRVYFLYVFSVV